MRAESCPDRRSALAGAAIGRLDEHELLALQAHLDGCAACRDELAELRSTAALIATVDLNHVQAAESRPPVALADHVVERVRDARSVRTIHRTRRRVGAIGATVLGMAAAIIAVIGIAMHSGPTTPTAQRHTVVLHGKDASARAVIIESHDGTDVTFRGKLSDGADSIDPYWLWLTDGSGRRLAAATFRDGKDGTFAIHGHGAIAYSAVKRVWVTDEANHVVLDSAA